MSSNLYTRDLTFPECPIRNILARISDKWSMLLLFTLAEKNAPVRFNSLKKEIPDISHKMLASTLRKLEEDGYVRRNVYAEVPPRVEYQITERALSLMPHINSLIDWALLHMGNIIKDREQFATNYS